MSSKILQWVGLIGIAATAPLVFTVISNSIKSADYFASAEQKYKKGNYQGALADYNRMIVIDPNDVKAYSSRGGLKYLKFNDAQGALTDLNRAIQIKANYPEAYRLRGLLKDLALNDRSGGIDDLKQAAKLFQQHGRTQDYQETIDMLKEWKQNSGN